MSAERLRAVRVDRRQRVQAEVLGRHQHGRAEAFHLEGTVELVGEHRLQAMRREYRERQEARGRDDNERDDVGEGGLAGLSVARDGRLRSARERPARAWRRRRGLSGASLRIGRSRTRAAIAAIASSISQRSKRVSKSEPRTSGEIPIAQERGPGTRGTGAHRALGRRCGEDAARAAETHEHRERRRVAPAHVFRQEHGRQRRPADTRTRSRGTARLRRASSPGVVQVERHVRQLALLEPGDEDVERDPEQDRGHCGRRPRPPDPPHSRMSNSSTIAGSSPISSGTASEVRQPLVEGDHAQTVLGLVRDPDVALRQHRQVLKDLLERRLRVKQVPDQDPRGHAGSLAPTS